MTEFFVMFAQLIKDIISTLDSFTFEIFDIPVSLSSLLFAFLVIGLVVSIFWRGAKT